jgi:hypothetical protein
MVLNQENALLPPFRNFASECVIRKVQLSQMGVKLNGTHQLLAYADDVNLLGENIYYKERHRNFN